jgi:HEAT repeat protein
MTPPQTHLFVSDQDKRRLAQVDRLTGAGGVSTLIEALDDPSWAVRRGVVAALARQGDAAVGPLCEVLTGRRSSETRLAAATDALVLSLGDVEAALAPLAESAAPAVLSDLAQVLGRRRSVFAVPLLERLTAHEDDNVAVAAIEALGRIGGGAAVDALIRAAQTGNFFRTFPAIDVLGRSGDPRVVPTLISLLASPVYASEAIRALGRTGDERAIAPLLRLFRTPGDTLLRATAVALSEVSAAQDLRSGNGHAVEDALREQALPQSLGRRLGACFEGAAVSERVALCRVLGWVGGGEAIAALLEQLHGEPEVGRAAARALADLGRSADAQLLATLRAGDSQEQLAVLPFLGRRGIASAEVVRCLESEDAPVRATACETLARLADPAAVRALFPRLADPDARVAQAALAAIQSLGSPLTESLTLEAARSNDLKIRRAALRIIAYFGYPSGLQALLEAMRHPDERIRDAAIHGLPFLEDARAESALLEAASHPSARTRAAAMRALGQAPHRPENLAALHRGLRDGDSWVRYYAAQALGRLGDANATEGLIALLEDPAGQVRVGALDAPALLNDDRAISALSRAARAGDPDIRRAALVGLGVAKRAGSLPLILEALDDAEPATRLVAISALAKLETQAVLPALLRSTRDGEPSVRNAAVGYLAARHGQAATQELVGLLPDEPLRDLVLSSLAIPVEGRIAGLLVALEDADERVAPLIVGALARMDRADAGAAILDALRTAAPPGRKAAAQAVAAWNDAAGRAALERAAREDADPEVRRISTLALVQ